MNEQQVLAGPAAPWTKSELETPVLLVIFNRPGTTKAVFESVRAVRPTRLYVAADGPRADVEGEAQRCDKARRIASAVDWGCKLETRFQDKNVGLDVHVSSAIDWFFELEEEGILLEDDCVPDPSFYRFCAELLGYYRETPEVMHVSGDNFQFGRRRGRGSYYFSKYPFIWGWATWRRAWKSYDITAASPDVQGSTWDAQWLHALERNRGVAIAPNLNLVTNIGFGEGATHTKTMERYSRLPARAMDFPLRHPSGIRIDRAADTLSYYVIFRNIRHIRFMWAHQLWDFVYRTLKNVKKELLARRSGSRISS